MVDKIIIETSLDEIFEELRKAYFDHRSPNDAVEMNAIRERYHNFLKRGKLKVVK